MRIKIYRGTHEIGGSCVEIQNRNTRIIIDIGIPLNVAEIDSDDILPKVEGLYSSTFPQKKVNAIFISHSHLDHYGLLGNISKEIPIFIGEASKDLIEISNLFMKDKCSINNYQILKAENPILIGSIKVTPFLIDHSAFDSYCFFIEADGKKILYTGDFRNHGRKGKLTDKITGRLSKHIDAVIIEGTNINRIQEKINTEENIENEIIEKVKNKIGINLIMLGSQNIDRIVSIYKATSKMKKILVVDIYTANILATLSKYAKIPYPSSDFKNIKVIFTQKLCRKLELEGKKDNILKFSKFKITKEEIETNKDNIMMIVKNSMLEEIGNIKGIENGTFIYSMWEGYLEKSTALLQFLERHKLEFIKIHTSGHANNNFIMKFIKEINPKMIIPIHTNYPKKFEMFGKNVKVLNDNQEIEIV